MECGCDRRREWLNEMAPRLGLGNRVAVVAEPVKEGLMNRGTIFVAGVAVGMWVIPWALRFWSERVS